MYLISFFKSVGGKSLKNRDPLKVGEPAPPLMYARTTLCAAGSDARGAAESDARVAAEGEAAVEDADDDAVKVAGIGAWSAAGSAAGSAAVGSRGGDDEDSARRGAARTDDACFFLVVNCR